MRVQNHNRVTSTAMKPHADVDQESRSFKGRVLLSYDSSSSTNSSVNAGVDGENRSEPFITTLLS